MAHRTAGAEFTEQQWVEKIAARRREIALPGYWQLLHENCARWAKEFSVSPFWEEAKKRLDRWRSVYKQEFGADLLTRVGLPDFVGKSAESIRDKLFRRCRAKPEFFDEAIPNEGAPVPKLSDLVRTRVVCKYIDGVEFVTNRLQELGSELNLNPQRSREGRLEGYFAQHLNVETEVIFRLSGGGQLSKIICEVQVASELATTMWEASHKIYEFSRSQEQLAENWQWNPIDRRFIANQLGHMIHLADGLLVQLRGTKGKS